VVVLAVIVRRFSVSQAVVVLLPKP